MSTGLRTHGNNTLREKAVVIVIVDDHAESPTTATATTAATIYQPAQSRQSDRARKRREEEDEFPEGGSAEFFGEVLEWDNLAEVASLQASPFAQTAQQTALAAAKPKKCKKNAVRRHGKCVSKTTLYGSVHLTITTAGKYKLRIKPSRQVLRALKKGKRMHVKLTLIFTPAGTTDHIRSAHVVTVHQKSKHKKK